MKINIHILEEILRLFLSLSLPARSPHHHHFHLHHTPHCVCYVLLMPPTFLWCGDIYTNLYYYYDNSATHSKRQTMTFGWSDASTSRRRTVETGRTYQAWMRRAIWSEYSIIISCKRDMIVLYRRPGESPSYTHCYEPSITPQEREREASRRRIKSCSKNSMCVRETWKEKKEKKVSRCECFGIECEFDVIFNCTS